MPKGCNNGPFKNLVLLFLHRDILIFEPSKASGSISLDRGTFAIEGRPERRDYDRQSTMHKRVQVCIRVKPTEVCPTSIEVNARQKVSVYEKFSSHELENLAEIMNPGDNYQKCAPHEWWRRSI